MVYRHKRVAFIVSSSQFLLGATIEYHLDNCQKKCRQGPTPYSLNTIAKMSKSFYVDNCVASVSNQTTLEQFIHESELIMQEAKFDFRGWECTDRSDKEEGEANVAALDLLWNKGTDTLKINAVHWPSYSSFEEEPVTKRFCRHVAVRQNFC